MLKCLPDIYWRIILWEDMLCFCQTRLKPIDILQAAGYHLWRWSLAGLSLFPLRVKNTVTFARHVKHLPFAPYLVSISNICGIWSKNQSNLSYFTVFAWELCFFSLPQEWRCNWEQVRWRSLFPGVSGSNKAERAIFHLFLSGQRFLNT